MTAVALAWVTIASGCGDDADLRPDGNGDSGAAGVYVVNEGNFTQGNSSLSFYDSASDSVDDFVFEDANGRPLGDVANDILVRGDRAWVVVNNSHRIESIETGTHLSVGTIEFPAGSGPYTLVGEPSSDIAYVPLLLSNRLAKVNLTAMTILDTIEVGANPTDVAIVGRSAYVTNGGFGSGTQVAVVDLDAFDVRSIIEVGDNPQAVVAGSGKVAVLCSGFFDDWLTDDADESTAGSIVFISPDTDAVTQSIPLDSGADSRMELGPDGIAYFLVQGTIASLDLGSEMVTPNFINAQTAGAAGFYGLGVDRTSGRIYATDAKDFASSGDVFVFESDGMSVTDFEADIIPRAFGFVE